MVCMPQIKYCMSQVSNFVKSDHTMYATGGILHLMSAILYEVLYEPSWCSGIVVDFRVKGLEFKTE